MLTVRIILVEGDAGIGKTTLCTALSEDWANRKLFQEFEILLLLHLRQKRIASAGSLLDLLKLLHPSQKICEFVAEYVEEQEGKVLIIADGWDELSTEDRSEGSFLYELLFGECYSLSIIVTSRPSASAPFHKLRCIDRFVEVHGFSNDNIKEFIQCEFASNVDKGSGLLEQLEGKPIVASVCSVPLNCAIVCHLWHHFDGALPTTMSELYTKIVMNIILRNIQKKSEYESIPSLPHFDSLPNSLQQPWSLLCELAFQTLSEDRIVFSHEDLSTRFKNLSLDSEVFFFGLLQSAESILVDGRGVSFHFLHLTFQEYLAALYLVRQPPEKQLQLCGSYAESKRFEMVYRFFFGLNFSVCNKPVDSDVSKLLVGAYPDIQHNASNTQTLCHFALEANQGTTTHLIASTFKESRNVLFKPHIAFDSAAIIHVIANLQGCYCDIDLSDCGLRDKQITALADALAGEHRKLQVYSINLRGNRLTDESLAVLFERASPAFSRHSLECDLRNNIIGPKTVNSITNVLAKLFPEESPILDFHPTSRKLLDISDSSLGVDGLKALRDALCANRLACLKELYLAGSLTDDADTNAELILALGSGHCPRLESLDLSRNNLGAPGGKAFGKILSDLHTLSYLKLAGTILGDKGVSVLIQNLKDTESCKLSWLYLDNNGIQAAGISCLGKSVCTGSIKLLSSVFGWFTIANNPLGLEGVIAVIKILASGHCQASNINLSGCQLTTAGRGATNPEFVNAVDVQQSICSQQLQATLVFNRFVLDDNNFSGEGIHILAAFMYACPNVCYLSCHSCGITSDDLKQLLVLISELRLKLPYLSSWELHNNDIDDNGVSALIPHLSMFPGLSFISFDGNIRVSPGMLKTLSEELAAQMVHLHCHKIYLESTCRLLYTGPFFPLETR